jgi:hypothetical protein
MSVLHSRTPQQMRLRRHLHHLLQQRLPHFLQRLLQPKMHLMMMML